MVVADVDCVVKVKDDCVVDGLAILNVVDGVFDVSVNLGVGMLRMMSKDRVMDDFC